MCFNEPWEKCKQFVGLKGLKFIPQISRTQRHLRGYLPDTKEDPTNMRMFFIRKCLKAKGGVWELKRRRVE